MAGNAQRRSVSQATKVQAARVFVEASQKTGRDDVPQWGRNLAQDAPNHAPGVADDIAEIARAAVTRRAQERLNRIDDRHAAYRLRVQGLSPRDIAAMLHATEPRVRRMLIAADAHDDAITPEEVILRATVHGTDRDELVHTLATMSYTFTAYAPGVLDDGSDPGTWTQVAVANLSGLLSDEEYERVCTVVRPPPPG
ncbi:hypothetical protein [Flexivirga meconopsidis]|uniref:hypothetical protein n=1 Tax=Flexivirga meconopsidis TaxID=2977121 RepID=UPI00223FBAE9|nr:hypothetical protein [Flexivirga meconopsidis]